MCAISVYLGTKSSLTRLSQADCWLMDGTFDIMLRIMRQLFTIHGRINTEISPLVFCLMSSKSAKAYKAFFLRLTQLSHEFNISLNPKRIIADFEKASVAAAKIHFPSSEFKGCLFHFGQIIWRRVQSNHLVKKYGQNENFNLKIRMIKSLAFVPENEILDYYSVLNNNLKTDKDAKSISDWFQKNYIGNFSENAIEKIVNPKYPGSYWSVAGSETLYFPRTQNNVEAWHRRLQVNKELMMN